MVLGNKGCWIKDYMTLIKMKHARSGTWNNGMIYETQMAYGVYESERMKIDLSSGAMKKKKD